VKPICLIAIAALCSACASSGAVPKPFPLPGGSAGSGGSTSSGGSGGSTGSGGSVSAPARNGFDSYALVGTALALRGVPYRNGGSEPTRGFDCSGFTQYVFAQYGVALPREVREQFNAGKNISAGDLEPGDLIFFSTTDPGPSHVGIAVGGDEFVHAPSSTGVVRVEHVSSSYWSPRFLGARRVN
jgi:cell wall-associated NlpC family hydrolase